MAPLLFSFPLQDVVFAMSLSPSGSLLATIDVSGRLCLWEVPSLRLRKAWEIGDQVGLPHWRAAM